MQASMQASMQALMRGLELGPQRFAVARAPAPHVVVDGVFGDALARRIHDEVVSLRPHFRPGGIGVASEDAPSLRRSLICAPDEVFHDDVFHDEEPTGDFAALIARRAERSVVLGAVDSLVLSHDLRDLFDAAPLPLCKLREVNRWETQIARYGDDDKYDWHIDRLGTDERLISIVYFLLDEPRAFTGGELELTDGLVRHGALASSEPAVTSIEVVRDRAVVFSARTAHRVRPVRAPEAFEQGRFSITIFAGVHGATPEGRAY